MVRNSHKITKKKYDNKKFIHLNKKCFICENKINFIDIFDTNLINKFQSESGKILSRNLTGNCPIHQRMIARAIKRARIVGLVL